MTIFRDQVSEWVDFDGAMFDLAVSLGVMSQDTSFTTDAKHVFWSSNQLGDALDDMLKILHRIGAVEHNSEDGKYRWNDRFSWREVSAKRGR